MTKRTIRAVKTSELRETVGAVVRRRREERGLTQQQAASEAGVGSTTWREFEHGKEANYRASTLYAMAKVLGWPIDAIETMLAGGPPPPAIEELDGDEVAVRLAAIERGVGEVLKIVRRLDPLGPQPGDEGQ